LIRDQDVVRLGCPDCEGRPLSLAAAASRDGARLVSGTLSCALCASRFPIEDGIPWLLPAGLHGSKHHGIESFPEEWKRWGERLEGFRGWRARTWETEPENRRKESEKLARSRRSAFAAFCGSISGRALEVGCGDGSLRLEGSFRNSEYWGVDPMPIEGQLYEFPFVAGVGERLPFRAGEFDAVIVKESLHHFQNPGRFLDEARRLTARGGALLLCQGVEESSEAVAASAGARVLLARAATAARLALRGDFSGIKDRMTRALGAPGRGAHGESGASGVGRDDDAHVMWHPTRDDVEFEVGRRFGVESSRMDGGVLYMKGRARA